MDDLFTPLPDERYPCATCGTSVPLEQIVWMERTEDGEAMYFCVSCEQAKEDQSFEQTQEWWRDEVHEAASWFRKQGRETEARRIDKAYATDDFGNWYDLLWRYWEERPVTVPRCGDVEGP